MTDQTSTIPRGWKMTTLGKEANKIGDGLHGTPEYSTSGEYYFVNGNNIENGRIVIKADTNKVDREEFEKYKKDLGKNTILLSINGTIGNLAKYKNEKCILGKSAAYINIKNENSQDFVYYLMLDSRFQRDISKNANGSTIKNVSLAQLRNYSFILPSITEQHAIAAVLSSLDDKIELLREQNKTLEATAQVIFKEWFVNFNFPGATGKMIDSELGEIPEGWKVGKVIDLIDILSGFAFPSSDFSQDGKYKLVTIKNVQDRYFDPETKDRFVKLPERMPSYCKLDSGDILLSLTGNVGRICLVNGEDYLLNQRVAKLRAKNPIDYAFSYLLFLQDSIFSLLQSTASGTAQQNLSPIQTKEIEIVVAERKTLDQFGAVANKLIQKINDNLSQIQTISALRDALLPKLMKGEVRVKI